MTAPDVSFTTPAMPVFWARAAAGKSNRPMNKTPRISTMFPRAISSSLFLLGQGSVPAASGLYEQWRDWDQLQQPSADAGVRAALGSSARSLRVGYQEVNR